MPILTEAAAESELSLVKTVDDLEAGAATYPYTRLTADDFERLAYALFTHSAPPGQDRFWEQVSIMVRGADSGRDVVLMAGGKLKGVVQCKRIESAIPLPAVLRELAKLILYAEVDDSLPPVGADLTYYLALAHESALTVIDFFDRPAEILANRVADIEAAVHEVLETYARLADLDIGHAVARVKAVLQGLRYRLLRPVLLDGWLAKETGIASRFFRHRLVVDHQRMDAQYSSVMEQMSQVLQQVQGVPLLTDVDLKLIKNRIESTPETHRVAIGVASLFGFPREMFMGGDNLRRRLLPIVDLINQLNAEFADWMLERSKGEANAICGLGKVVLTVHPFALQVPRAFLVGVALDITRTALLGRLMGEIAAKHLKRPVFATDEARLAEVREELLTQGRCYLKGDFTQVKGDDELRKTKVNLFRYLLRGLLDEAELVRRLDQGINVMRPHLFGAASRLRELGAHSPCVFLTGTYATDDPSTWDRVAATSQSLEAGMARWRSGAEPAQPADPLG